MTLDTGRTEAAAETAVAVRPHQLVGDLLRLHARSAPDREALVVVDERFTYGQINAYVNRVASALQAAGIGHGDRVAVLARNSKEYFALYFATAKLGALLVPLNVWHRADGHRYALEDADPKLVFHQAAFADVLAEAATGTAAPRIEIPVAGAGVPVPPDWQAFLDRGTTDAEPAAVVGPDDAHMILYTSGTTGRPKGAVLSHTRTMTDALNMSLALRIRADDTFINFFPPFHVGNWDHMKLFLVVGARVVLLPEFDATEALRLIPEERVTVLLGVPTMLRGLLDSPAFATADLSSLRLLYYGAYDPSGIMRQMADALGAAEGRAEMGHTYGLTEGGPFIAFCRPEDVFRKWGSIGRAVPGVEVELLDDDGAPVGVGEPGEICARGPVMSGYWRKPEATAAAFAGGWLHTGDIAVRDDEGFLRIVDRKKDMIRTGGQNVYSKEVEDVLLEHPDVLDVAVVGVPDDLYEESVCAVVVTRTPPADAGALADDLRRFVRARTAGYNVPRRIELVDALPKNAVGKTLKHELRAELGSMFLQPAHGGADRSTR